MLGRDRFERAAGFLEEHARPLERAQFERAFRGGSAEAVAAALAPYQNEDGGYGQGLEPDVASGGSGGVPTAWALGVLAELEVPSDHPQVQRAARFLRATLDPEALTWPIVAADAADGPHAPWWASEGLAERFGHFRINPRGELVAALYRFPEAVDEAWLTPVAEDCVRAIETTELAMHDLLNAVALLEAPGLPVGLRARVRAVLESAAPSAVATDWDAWHTYVLQPLQVAPRPDAALHHLFAEPIQWNLDFLIQTQGEDGAWAPSWSWGAFPDAWERARRAWQGVLTLRALRALAAFGRIEGVPAGDGA